MPIECPANFVYKTLLTHHPHVVTPVGVSTRLATPQELKRLPVAGLPHCSCAPVLRTIQSSMGGAWRACAVGQQ